MVHNLYSTVYRAENIWKHIRTACFNYHEVVQVRPFIYRIRLLSYPLLRNALLAVTLVQLIRTDSFKQRRKSTVDDFSIARFSRWWHVLHTEFVSV